MLYTIAEAVTATGLEESLILKAIEDGQITGTKNVSGEWHVEDAELHSLYFSIAQHYCKHQWPSHQTGLPRLPEPPFRRAVPTTPTDQAGAHVDCFPAHAAFPKWQEGRHPHCHFRGLLRLHSRYGPPDRSAAHRRPLSRGSNPCGYPHKPLVSYRINRQLSGWIPPPLMIRAFGAHCHNRTRAVQHSACFIRSPRRLAFALKSAPQSQVPWRSSC